MFKLELFFPNLTVKEHIRKDDATLIIGCLSDNDIVLENDSMLVAHEGIAHMDRTLLSGTKEVGTVPYTSNRLPAESEWRCTGNEPTRLTQ